MVRVCLFTARVRGLAQHTRTPGGGPGPAACSAPGPVAAFLARCGRGRCRWPRLEPGRRGGAPFRRTSGTVLSRRPGKSGPPRRGAVSERAQPPARVALADPVLPAAPRPRLCPGTGLLRNLLTARALRAPRPHRSHGLTVAPTPGKGRPSPWPSGSSSPGRWLSPGLGEPLSSRDADLVLGREGRG